MFDAQYVNIRDEILRKFNFGSGSGIGSWFTSTMIAKLLHIHPITQSETRVISRVMREQKALKRRRSDGVFYYLKKNSTIEARHE